MIYSSYAHLDFCVSLPSPVMAFHREVNLLYLLTLTPPNHNSHIGIFFSFANNHTVSFLNSNTLFFFLIYLCVLSVFFLSQPSILSSAYLMLLRLCQPIINPVRAFSSLRMDALYGRSFY